LAAIIEMQEKIKRTGTITGREFAERRTSTGPPPFDRDELRRSQEATPVPNLEVYTPPTMELGR
jgi:hypothetical protein